MGNNISRLCGEPNCGSAKLNEADLEDKFETDIKTKVKNSINDNLIVKNNYVILIQKKFREFLAKEKKNKIQLEENQKEFEENLASIGTQITDEEMNLKISEKVKSLEESIPSFNPTKEELTKFKQTFIRDPIQFEDGSIYKGSWYSKEMRKGYGVLINPQGYKYEGFWINDKLNGRGRFIDDKGNYYEGK
jgi:hypothetical protein